MQEERKLDKKAVISSDYTENDIKIDRQLAMTCHTLGLITSILGPLIFVLTKRNDAEFLRHHEREAFNFQLTVVILMALSIYLDFFIFAPNYYAIPIVVISNLTFSITAVIKANDDVFYKYPISIPFLNPKPKKNVAESNDNGSEKDKSK